MAVAEQPVMLLLRFRLFVVLFIFSDFPAAYRYLFELQLGKICLSSPIIADFPEARSIRITA